MAASSTQLEPPATNRRLLSRLFVATSVLAAVGVAAAARHASAARINPLLRDDSRCNSFLGSD